MKVVLALPTSSANTAVLEAALGRPWPPATYFEVISVCEPSISWAEIDAALEAVRQAQQVVADAIVRIQAAGTAATGPGAVHRAVAGALFSGDPRCVILERARAIGADWLMIGSGERGRLRFGTEAAAVLRHAPCSVGIVRAKKPRKGGSLRILLATDGSAFSEKGAKSIAARPWPAGTRVRIVSVPQLICPSSHGRFEAPQIDSVLLEVARDQAFKRAQAAVARAREIVTPSGLDLSDSISVQDNRPAAILEEARTWDADLLVAGTRGIGSHRSTIGSIAEAVAMHAECSVEIIR